MVINFTTSCRNTVTTRYLNLDSVVCFTSRLKECRTSARNRRHNDVSTLSPVQCCFLFEPYSGACGVTYLHIITDKGKGKVVPVHPMTCGGVEVQLFLFLTSALDALPRWSDPPVPWPVFTVWGRAKRIFPTGNRTTIARSCTP